MTTPKNPILHAVLANAYIIALVLGIFFGLAPIEESQLPEYVQLLFPIVMLSLFTLSAAVMGYLFLGVPLQRYMDGKKKEALSFFFQTVGAFAVITGIVIVIAMILMR